MTATNRQAVEYIAARLKEGKYGGEPITEHYIQRLKETFSPVQRAMIGALVAEAMKGRVAPKNRPTHTLKSVAAMLGIREHGITEARLMWARATEQEIGMVLDETVGLNTVRRLIFEGKTIDQRKKIYETPVSQRGGNVAGYEKQAFDSELWNQFRKGVELLAGLPSPRDFGAIAKRFGRSGFVEKMFPLAAEWVKEFEDERRGKDQGPAARADADGGDTGPGDEDAGTEQTEPPSQ